MSFSFGSAGTSGPRPAAQSGGDRRRVNPFTITVVVLLALVGVVLLASHFGTSYLWFSQLDFRRVLLTRWGVQGGLFLGIAVITAVPLFFSMRWAHRARPITVPTTRDDELLDQFRSSIEPLRKVLTIAIPVVVGIFSGLAVAQEWQNVLLWANSTNFGQSDPVFGHDTSFYAFALPVIISALSALETIVLGSVILAAIVHYIYGGVGIVGRPTFKVQITKPARRQLGILLAVYVLLLGVRQWIGRYELLTDAADRFTGAGYTDIHANLPAKTIIAIVALIVAAALVWWAVRGDWRIAVAGVGLLAISMLAISWAYPALIEKFRVEPNAQNLEAEYIGRNIDATQTAFGLDDIDVVNYDATTDAAQGALRSDAQTTASIRLLDPTIVSPSFAQLQQVKQFYGFSNPLSVDRYNFDGQMHDTVIGVRELNLGSLDSSQQGWVNEHTIYTHGYGVAAAYGNQRAGNGGPDFFERGIPSEGNLGSYEQAIYFGQNSPDYSIVGAPSSTTPQEFDYPAGDDQDVSEAASGSDTSASDSSGSDTSATVDDSAQVNVTYDGDGGPSLGGFWSKLLYAVKFRDINILISNYVNDDSQILYDRDPVERVKSVAPFLTPDSSVYPAVVDGRTVWIVDAYTTSEGVPYAERVNLSDATADSQQSEEAFQSLSGKNPNYVRNSVKAVVDAYDGSVTLYAWDETDPILQSWEKAFPGTFTPASEISGDLMSHLRYPSDLFKVQRTLLTRYHIDDPKEFYSAQDIWRVPDDPTVKKSEDSVTQSVNLTDGTLQEERQGSTHQPAYYLTMKMPDDDEPAFTLSTSFIPGGGSGTGRQIMTGFLAVNSETGNQAGQVASGYGKLTLLELPRSSSVSGPGQVQNQFDTDPEVSTELNLLAQGNSRVISGNLLTIPVGGGLLYVQPVYVQSSGSTSYPLLQRVLVSFGDKIGFAPTLDEALDEVFGGDSGAQAGDADVDGSGTSSGGDSGGATGSSDASGSDTGGSASTSDPQADLDAALTDMQTAMDDADTALQNGDWNAYGEAQKRIEESLDRAEKANDELQGEG